MTDILTRGVEVVLPSREALAERLRQGPIKLYHGIDPTASFLHLGHLATLLKVRDFQDQGHEIVILFGGFTATIGDPTNKLAVRTTLSVDEVETNMADYQNLILKILNPQKTTFVNNRDWYEKMPLLDFINLTTKVTIQQSLKRDMFKRRQEKGKDIYVNEFLYPILHGYDSVILGVDLEIGGNDQLFNMLVGRDLAKKLKGQDKMVMTTKLLIDSSGKKMGKTEGNMVNLADSPSQMFGQIMSWSDELMPLGFEILTRIPNTSCKEILAGHPKKAKLTLAQSIVGLIYGEAAALEAKNLFEQTFSEGEITIEPIIITAATGDKIIDVLVAGKIVKSKSDFRRLVAQGGVEVESLKLTDPDYKVTTPIIVKIGAHRFIKITLN